MSLTTKIGDFTTIPESIKRRIFSFLDYKGIIAVSLVCHDFYQIAQHDELWKKEFVEEFGDVNPFIMDIENHPKEKVWKSNFISTCGYPGYEWDVVNDSDDKCIEISIPIPPKTSDSQIDVQFTANTIKAGLVNQTPIVQGKLVGTIKTNESNWTIQRDGEESFDHLVLTIVPEDINEFVSTVEGTQYNIIQGPRIDGDLSTVDVLSKQIVGENIASLPMMNPFQVGLDYDGFEDEDNLLLDRDVAEKKLQDFLNAMMSGKLEDYDESTNGHNGEDYEHDIHEVDDEEAAEIQREQHRRKLEMDSQMRRSALRQSNKKVSFSIPDTNSGEFRLDGNSSGPPPPSQEKKKEKKNEGFRFNFDSKSNKTKLQSSTDRQIVSQDGSVLEPILASAQETYSNWKYQIWMGAALFAAFQLNSWLSK